MDYITIKVYRKSLDESRKKRGDGSDSSCNMR